MAKNKDKYTDNSGDRKYFAMVPYYIVNHSTAYEQSLYLVMKRIASEEGTCWASPKEIAKRMGVAPNTVRKNIEKLITREWIKKIGIKQIGKTGQYVNEYELVDLWKKNLEYIESEMKKVSHNEPLKVSPGELKVSPGESKSSPGGNKEETMKNNNQEEVAKLSFADLQPLIKLFEGVNPTYERLFKNTTQRAALARLVSKFGEEKITNLLKELPNIIVKKYAPRITTPLELERDLGKLIAFVRQEKTTKAHIIA